MESAGTIQFNFFDPPADYQQSMLEAWKKFTTNQQLDLIVPPLIAASWRRCWGRVNPNKRMEFIHMGKGTSACIANRQFRFIGHCPSSDGRYLSVCSKLWDRHPPN